MKPYNKKIEAFTISEMLVVLVISSIVISLALMALNLVQKQLKTMHNNYRAKTEIRLLEKALIQDFNRHHLFYKSETNELIGVSIKDTVVYKFKEKYVLRNNDTLNIAIHKSVTYLDGNTVNKNAIDAIKLQFSKQFQEKKLFISKTKDATFYLNNNGI